MGVGKDGWVSVKRAVNFARMDEAAWPDTCGEWLSLHVHPKAFFLHDLRRYAPDSIHRLDHVTIHIPAVQ